MYKPHTIEQYKIQLIDEQGAERTLLLSKTAKFQIGARYRFYFQKGSRPAVGNDYLDAALSTNCKVPCKSGVSSEAANEKKSETAERVITVFEKIASSFSSKDKIINFPYKSPLFCPLV